MKTHSLKLGLLRRYPAPLPVLCAVPLLLCASCAYSAPQSATPEVPAARKTTKRPANRKATKKPAARKPSNKPAAPNANNMFAVKDEADFFGLLDLNRPEMASVKAAVDAKNWTAAKAAWAKHLETRTSPRWLWSHTDRAGIKKVLDDKFDGLKSNVPIADKTLNREFSAQGVTKTLGKYPVWIHGTGEWTNVLNRFNFFRPMGLAYWETGDSKYVEDAVLLLKDWIAKNPVPDEVIKSASARANPWRTLETGIRIQAWLNAMQLFMDAPAFDAQAKYEMTRSLVEHSRRLYEHESAFKQGNWQVVECTGLASAGMLLPEFKESSQWRQRAFQYMVEHMQKDVRSDGAHWELAPSYHFWVMNQFLDVALLAKRNGYEIPGLLDRHEKMYDFLARMSRPDRHMQGTSDSGDSGVLTELGVGALLYNRPDFRFLATPEAKADWVWRFGPDVAERYAKLPAKQPDFLSQFLPGSQYTVMRTGWGENDPFFFFDAGPWGGPHSHQDRLQVTLFKGHNLLVDPGQYSYDRPLSKHFRMATSHNVLLVDGDKQIQANPKVLAWQDTPNATLVSAQIEDQRLRHQRSVLWVKPDYWVVVDHVGASTNTGPPPAGGPMVGSVVDTTEAATAPALVPGAEHEITRYFHFPLDLDEAKAIGNTVQSAFAQGTNLQIQAIDASTVQIRKDWLPIDGSTAKEAPVAAFVFKGTLPATLCSVLTPFTDAKALPKVELVPGAGADAVTHLRLSFADGGRDEIAVAAAPTALKIGTHEATGRALIVRQSAKGETVSTIQ